MQSAAAAELSAALEMPSIARRAAAIGVDASSSSSSVDNESLTIAFDGDDDDDNDGRKSSGSSGAAATADPNDIFSKSWVCCYACAHIAILATISFAGF